MTTPIHVHCALFLHFSLKDAFLFAVGIAAAMIPEGLPAEVSIALSLASGRLAKNKALVKQLASVETLGCVNIICTDQVSYVLKIIHASYLFFPIFYLILIYALLLKHLNILLIPLLNFSLHLIQVSLVHGVLFLFLSMHLMIYITHCN